MSDDIRILEPLVGTWEIVIPKFGARAETTFEWILRGAALLQHASPPDPVPASHCIYAAGQNGAFTQHYFDSRGVVRLYAMTFGGTAWTLQRRQADFSPLAFHQRFAGAFTDPDTIQGRWEIAHDGATWELDFELTYHRR